MGRSFCQWFNDRFRKPRHEFVACAVMLSWHPAAGFAAHDPLTGRHFAHRPGTTVIHNYPSPSKLAADYFPATPFHAPNLPRHIYGSVQYTHSFTEVAQEGGAPTVIERFELRDSSPEAFIFQRRLHADGRVELEASYGQLRKLHQENPQPDSNNWVGAYVDRPKGLQ